MCMYPVSGVREICLYHKYYIDDTLIESIGSGNDYETFKTTGTKTYIYGLTYTTCIFL